MVGHSADSISALGTSRTSSPPERTSAGRLRRQIFIAVIVRRAEQANRWPSGVVIYWRIVSGRSAQLHQLLGQQRFIAPLAPTRLCARRAPIFTLVLNNIFKIGCHRYLLRVRW